MISHYLSEFRVSRTKYMISTIYGRRSLLWLTDFRGISPQSAGSQARRIRWKGFVEGSCSCSDRKQCDRREEKGREVHLCRSCTRDPPLQSRLLVIIAHSALNLLVDKPMNEHIAPVTQLPSKCCHSEHTEHWVGGILGLNRNSHSICSKVW